MFDEREVRLLDFGREPATTFTDNYDFGDDWRHVVEIEQCHAIDLMPKFATCIGGAQARPPEDVGGVGGYEEFLTVMADPHDPEHAHTKRWCGGHFDPGWFDLTLTDKDVRNALRPNARRRLHQPKPKRSKPSSGAAQRKSVTWTSTMRDRSPGSRFDDGQDEYGPSMEACQRHEPCLNPEPIWIAWAWAVPFTRSVTRHAASTLLVIG